jgi:hypothetical protein
MTDKPNCSECVKLPYCMLCKTCGDIQTKLLEESRRLELLETYGVKE